MSIIDGSTQKVIAVDFDDTLCESAFPECGPVKPGAKEAMIRFREMGFLILIYSCRSCHWHYNLYGGSREIPVMDRHQVIKMRDWLIEQGIPFDEIDDGSRGKPLANYYIDDKGVRYSDNWEQVVAFIEYKEEVKEILSK